MIRTAAQAFALLSRAACLAAAALPATGPAARATTYYVDFATGSDTASGLTPQTPWKRAPGDSRAGAGPRNVRLQPGDTLLFRGGTAYRGTIVVRQAGSPEAPIRYVGNGWGPDSAILDGAEPAIDARPCRSARDCGGEPNWMHLVRVSLASDTLPSEGLFQADRQLLPAPPGALLPAGSMRPIAGTRARAAVVNPYPDLGLAFAAAAGRVGFLIVAGGDVQIEGFTARRFARAPRFGPYAGSAVVQLQPLDGVRLVAAEGLGAIRQAPPIGPALAGVTSGPI